MNIVETAAGMSADTKRRIREWEEELRVRAGVQIASSPFKIKI